MQPVDSNRLSNIINFYVEFSWDEIESYEVHLYCETVAKAHKKQDRCCSSIVRLSTQATTCFVFLSHEKSKVDHFSHYQNIADYECCRNNFELQPSHPNKRRT